MHEPTSPNEPRIEERRRLLRRGAAAGAAVWVTPTIATALPRAALSPPGSVPNVTTVMNCDCMMNCMQGSAEQSVEILGSNFNLNKDDVAVMLTGNGGTVFNVDSVDPSGMSIKARVGPVAQNMTGLVRVLNGCGRSSPDCDFDDGMGNKGQLTEIRGIVGVDSDTSTNMYAQNGAPTPDETLRVSLNVAGGHDIDTGDINWAPGTISTAVCCMQSDGTIECGMQSFRITEGFDVQNGPCEPPYAAALQLSYDKLGLNWTVDAGVGKITINQASTFVEVQGYIHQTLLFPGQDS